GCAARPQCAGHLRGGAAGRAAGAEGSARGRAVGRGGGPSLTTRRAATPGRGHAAPTGWPEHGGTPAYSRLQRAAMSPAVSFLPRRGCERAPQTETGLVPGTNNTKYDENCARSSVSPGCPVASSHTERTRREG